MNKQHAVTFLKHRTIIEGQATVELRSEIEYTVATGEDENSVVEVINFCKNGLIVLSNSETREMWSNRKPTTILKDEQPVIVFESE